MSKITVKTLINAPVAFVWEVWTSPSHITKWYSASDDWHAPRAENDLKVDGRFLTRMEAKDGSVGFDFEGTYTKVNAPFLLAYKMDDGREVEIKFEVTQDETIVTEIFDAETENPEEMQRKGWQSILNNFKNYVEEIYN